MYLILDDLNSDLDKWSLVRGKNLSKPKEYREKKADYSCPEQVNR